MVTDIKWDECITTHHRMEERYIGVVKTAHSHYLWG